jgi:SAM-dependent methyltransferase
MTLPQLRSDYKAMQSFYRDRRSEERLIAHYLLERQLAHCLRSASRADRGGVYTRVYGELFRSLPDHPQKFEDGAVRVRHTRRLITRLQRFLGKEKTFMEIGCGDAVLSIQVAPHVKRSYAVDVTDELIDRTKLPANMEIVLTEGVHIPLPDNSVDVAMSDQLMEHLHPDDARDQLAEIYRVLKPGGAYHCITPNRVIGPHDVSHYFEYEASGFHLQEYDAASIRQLFKQAGFRRIRFVLPLFFGVPLPRGFLRAMEVVLWAMSAEFRGWVSRQTILTLIIGINAIGFK